MKRLRILAGVVSAMAAMAATAAAQPATYYQIDLAPSGRMFAVDAPLVKGSNIVFHGYPSGTLISVRRADVKVITKITPQAAGAATTPDSLVQIGNLAMQGGSTQAGATNAAAARTKAAAPKGPELGQGFYSDLKMGETLAQSSSTADYQIGRSYAAPPSSGVQSSPGAPPTAPAATNGQNPPQ